MGSNIRAHGWIIGKKVCVIRWGVVSSLDAIRFHYSSVRTALSNLHEETDNSLCSIRSLITGAEHGSI